MRPTPSQRCTPDRGRRQTVGVAVAFALIVSILAFGFSVAPSAAYCEPPQGSRDGAARTLATRWGKEGPRSSTSRTCVDGDRWYSGRVQDIKTDRQAVHVRIANNSAMRGETIQVSTGGSRNYGINGSHFLRICESGTRLGASTGVSTCTKPVNHGPS